MNDYFCKYSKNPHIPQKSKMLIGNIIWEAIVC